MYPKPTNDYVADSVRRALEEDVGSGDLTAALVPSDQVITAHLLCRESAVLCGTDWFNESMRQVDQRIACDWLAADGQRLDPNTRLASVQGPARGILTAERTGLNFVQLLSATATAARRYADAVADYPTTVLDTRKTIPGLRVAQKYAVRCGGGANHRIGLFDAYLIKENHIGAAGSIAQAVLKAREDGNKNVLLEVEVETLKQLDEAVEAGVDRVLLDNFELDDLRAAVQMHGKAIDLEASGGVTLETIGSIAATGVDFISVGAMTKHVQATDLSLRIQS